MSRIPDDDLGGEPEIKYGAICARCASRFTEAHGRPVLCPPCYHGRNEPKRRFTNLPLAWFETEAL